MLDYLIRHRCRVSLAICTALFFCLSPCIAEPLAFSEENGDLTELVITPNRLPKPINKVASSITVISARDIEEKKQRTVIEALSAVPGVQVVQSGGFGGNTGIFLRGANAEHTLVLIDGIEVNDPIATARQASVANMTLDDVERIEILRGPQSVLYGSDALGGVINIITKKGSGTPNGKASVESGSYNTSTERSSINGEENGLHYSISGTRIDSGSISQANAALGNAEKDQYDNTSFSGHLNYDVDERSEVSAVFRTHLSHTDIDNFGGVGGDDPNRLFGQKQFFSRVQAKVGDLDPRLTQIMGISYSNQRFRDNNSPDADHPLDALVSAYKSDMVKMDFLNSLALDPATISLGFETENERGSSTYFSTSEFGDFQDDFSRQENRTNAAFMQTDIDWLDRFSSTAGVRVDDAQFLDPQVTWRAGQNIQVPETGSVLRASVGTGFKVPSLFQRFSQYGRTDLRAEKSLGVDAGVEQAFFSNALVLSTTYFWNNFHNLITFDSGTFLYENVNQARTQGIEVASTVKLCRATEMIFSYTFLKPQDLSNNEDLLRRARHKVGFDLRSAVGERWQGSLSGSYVGQRLDNDFSTFPASARHLGGYTVVNATATFKAVRNVEIYAKVENIFDREYEGVIGFGAPGAAAYGGLVLHY